jgi:hypothetical protein
MAQMREAGSQIRAAVHQHNKRAADGTAAYCFYCIIKASMIPGEIFPRLRWQSVQATLQVQLSRIFIIGAHTKPMGMLIHIIINILSID